MPNKNHPLKISKQGDVKIHGMREIMPTKEDFFLWEFHAFATDLNRVEVMLAGDRNIVLKFWDKVEGNGKPTIVNTGLKWKTFSLDDNIIVLVRDKEGCSYEQIVFFTKKYHKERT